MQEIAETFKQKFENYSEANFRGKISNVLVSLDNLLTEITKNKTKRNYKPARMIGTKVNYKESMDLANEIRTCSFARKGNVTTCIAKIDKLNLANVSVKNINALKDKWSEISCFIDEENKKVYL